MELKIKQEQELIKEIYKVIPKNYIPTLLNSSRGILHYFKTSNTRGWEMLRKGYKLPLVTFLCSKENDEINFKYLDGDQAKSIVYASETPEIVLKLEKYIKELIKFDLTERNYRKSITHYLNKLKRNETK
jgi:hypothetical protein